MNPFKIFFEDKEAEKIFHNLNLAFLLGRINKLKNFNLDGVESHVNLEGVKVPKDNMEEILRGKSIWILSEAKLRNRTLSSTNPESLNNLTNEDREKCKVFTSIIKNELVDLNTIDYFKKSLEL